MTTPVARPTRLSDARRAWPRQAVRVVLCAMVLACLRPDAAVAQSDTAAPPAAPPTALVFQGVTVVDVKTGRRRPDQTLVIAGNRIQRVGPSGAVAAPAGARVLQATGTYAIPGLWDMHAHPFGLVFPLFIANGVTGIRDMSSPVPLAVQHEWRREIAAGQRIGPRIVTPGPALFDTKYRSKEFGWPFGRNGIIIATVEEARHAVDSLKEAGADFIKVHGEDFSREIYFAILTEARRVGLPVAGHLPIVIAPGEASDSGHRSMEHGLFCNAKSLAETDDLTLYKPAECEALARKFLRNGTWLSTGNPFACWLLASDCTDQVRYWPKSVFRPDPGEHWDPLPELDRRRPEGRSLQAWAKAHEGVVKGEQLYAPLRRAGIRFLAGSDAAPIFLHIVPGFSLHDELWNMVVRDGLTPLEALQAATLNPAAYFNATDSMGTIAAGKVADLVLLDADPLQDIYNTRRIRAVVANGRFFDRGDLDALLIEAKRAGPGAP